MNYRSDLVRMVVLQNRGTAGVARRDECSSERSWYHEVVCTGNVADVVCSLSPEILAKLLEPQVPECSRTGRSGLPTSNGADAREGSCTCRIAWLGSIEFCGHAASVPIARLDYRGREGIGGRNFSSRRRQRDLAEGPQKSRGGAPFSPIRHAALAVKPVHSRLVVEFHAIVVEPGIECWGAETRRNRGSRESWAIQGRQNSMGGGS